MKFRHVILVIIDSLRQDHVGCYGNPWIRTPNLDAFGHEALRFRRGYPEALPTIPVRRALHTGMRTFPFRNYLPRKGDTVRTYGWEPIPEEQVTLAEILHHEGFRTALVTDVLHEFKPAMNFHRGFDSWTYIRGQENDRWRTGPLPPHVDLDRLLLPEYYTMQSSSLIRDVRLVDGVRQYLQNVAHRVCEEDYFPAQVFMQGARWLEENRDAERAFLVVDSFDPHEPWDPPQYYRDLYNPGYQGKELILPMAGRTDNISPEQLKQIRALYAGEVTMVDHWFGYFLRRAAELGFLDNSLVIVVSDHGHPLGEHGFIRKLPYVLYPELMDIPYMVRFPDKQGAGSENKDALVSHVDLAPTILDYLGIEPPLPMDGISWRRAAEGRGRFERTYATSAFRDYVWAFDGQWAFLAKNNGEEARLYRWADDPSYQRELSAQYPAEVRRLLDLVRKDAGGELPNYDVGRGADEWYSV